MLRTLVELIKGAPPGFDMCEAFALKAGLGGRGLGATADVVGVEAFDAHDEDKSGGGINYKYIEIFLYAESKLIFLIKNVYLEKTV